eukprot:6413656-Amphidinium_carterae.1
MASRLGRELLTRDISDVFRSSVCASLAKRSTGTIVKHASDFNKLRRWCQEHSADALPTDENLVFQYLNSPGLFPTSGVSLTAALAFAGGVLGLDGALEAASTPRVQGRCH